MKKVQKKVQNKLPLLVPAMRGFFYGTNYFLEYDTIKEKELEGLHGKFCIADGSTYLA